MKLADLIHAPSRTTWTVRLLLYIIVIVTTALVVQLLHAFWL